MSCFSCFSGDRKESLDGYVPGRPVRQFIQNEKVSVSQVDASLVRGRNFDTTAIEVSEKEIDVKVSEVGTEYDPEYDSEDDYQEDIEKCLSEKERRELVELHYHQLVRRSVVKTPKFARKKSDAPAAVETHHTGEEHQMRFARQQVIALITDPTAKSQAQVLEIQRQQKWHKDRYP